MVHFPDAKPTGWSGRRWRYLVLWFRKVKKFLLRFAVSEFSGLRKRIISERLWHDQSRIGLSILLSSVPPALGIPHSSVVQKFHFTVSTPHQLSTTIHDISIMAPRCSPRASTSARSCHRTPISHSFKSSTQITIPRFKLESTYTLLLVKAFGAVLFITGYLLFMIYFMAIAARKCYDSTGTSKQAVDSRCRRVLGQAWKSHWGLYMWESTIVPWESGGGTGRGGVVQVISPNTTTSEGWHALRKTLSRPPLPGSKVLWMDEQAY